MGEPPPEAKKMYNKKNILKLKSYCSVGTKVDVTLLKNCVGSLKRVTVVAHCDDVVAHWGDGVVH